MHIVEYKKGLIHMMTILENYVRRGQLLLRRWTAGTGCKTALKILGWLLAGFCLSAASLGNRMQPLCLAVLCVSVPGWMPLAFALGSVAGYRVFWGDESLQALFWVACSLPVCVLFAQSKLGRTMPLLQPAIAALIVAVGGVVFQLWWGDSTPIVMYLLRVALAFGCTWVGILYRDRRDPATEWILYGFSVLALAQIAPLPFLGLGFLAGAMLVAMVPFPAVALAGLALDLAQITPVPMTAVLCLSYLLRLLPGIRRAWVAVAPVAVYALVMALCGQWDLMPMPMLLLGGIVGALLPRRNVGTAHRRGETGFAQVRLELAAEVIVQSERLLLEIDEPEIDEEVLMQKAAERACGGCPCRKTCKELENAKKLPTQLLHRTLSTVDDIPISCKKRARLLPELRHSQERYRTIKADRDSRQEYRGAVLQQYRFLSEYLQDLADRLPQRGGSKPRFQPEVAVCASGREKTNGDKCLWFAGTECRYYLLICDGMGTGDGAAREAGVVADMLRRLLMAGYPAPYALRSINSICTLRGDAGAVTVDLAEFCLDNGKVTVYKWGAVPSWLLLPNRAERIGSVIAPPGFSVTQSRETVDRLTMRKGEALVLVSDGVDAPNAVNAVVGCDKESAGTLAAKILEHGELEDDATVAVIRLTAV